MESEISATNYLVGPKVYANNKLLHAAICADHRKVVKCIAPTFAPGETRNNPEYNITVSLADYESAKPIHLPVKITNFLENPEMPMPSSRVALRQSTIASESLQELKANIAALRGEIAQVRRENERLEAQRKALSRECTAAKQANLDQKTSSSTVTITANGILHELEEAMKEKINQDVKSWKVKLSPDNHH